jgi:uncharacterized membrane protein YdjX (TVP38/TMEM64 family)
MKRSVWLKILCALVILGGFCWALAAFGVDIRQLTPERVRVFVLSFGVLAPAVYILAYAQPIIPLPASVMTGLAGAAFGKGWGMLAALIGATLRALTEFLVARLLGRDVVAKLLKGKIADLNQKLGENSFKAVLLIRLIPNFPFDVQNYGLGFSKVRFMPYMFASFIGLVPGSFAFVYLGESLTEPKQLWKLGIAIALIIGLMMATSKWKRHQAPCAAAHQLEVH